MLRPFVYIYTEKDYDYLFEKTGFVIEKTERIRHIALFVKARKR